VWVRVMDAKPVALTFTCNQRGCYHGLPIEGTQLEAIKVDGGYERRVFISDDQMADAKARASAHLDEHLQNPCIVRAD
jgi:hypothetical protein